MITLARSDLLVFFVALVAVGVACFLTGLFTGVTQRPEYERNRMRPLALRRPALLRRTKVRLILDHHREVERLLVERDDARRIVSDQLAQNGELSRQLRAADTQVETLEAQLDLATQEQLHLRRQVEHVADERDLARTQVTLLSTATWGLAESWDRLGSVQYAARELRDLLQLVGLAPHGTIPEEPLILAPLPLASLPWAVMTDPPAPERP
ncbi:hypothetical protein GCM10022224_103630 [Nonomuraea antimicrobica]|uniref:Uncharacterized protein n=1 Tax=Nonomuraea antimicrobica TaxID=561173 RepID=A0ABP7EM40_9ACTN